MLQQMKHMPVEKWTRLLKDEASSTRLTDGNHVTLFTDGDASFRVMWDDMQQARERIWLETYNFDPDAVGRRTIRELTDAAQRGCDVVLIYDSQGSPNMDARLLQPIRDAGGLVVNFNVVYPWRQQLLRRLGHPLHRDHRKILVVDDNIAYSGGRNVSGDYAGEALGSGRFIDTLLRIEGPAARDLGRIFLQSLHKTTHDDRSLPEPEPVASGATPVRALALDARENIRMLDRALKQAIDQAQSRCYVSAAYFVVPPWLRKTLARASDRGVDVRVVTAGQSDVTTARLAKRHAYGELLKRGVQLFEMYSQALHSKYIVIDDCLCLVGSHNLDRWSDLHNLEVSVAVVNPDLAGRLVETFHAYADQSEPYTLDDWRSRPLHQRAQQWILYALMQL